MRQAVSSDHEKILDHWETGPQAAFVRERRNVGCANLAISQISNCPPGAYPDPALDGIHLQMAQTHVRGRMDLGDGGFDVDMSVGSMAVTVPSMPTNYELANKFSVNSIYLPAKFCLETLEARELPDLGPLYRQFFHHTFTATLFRRALDASLDPQTTDHLKIDALATVLVHEIAGLSHRRKKQLKEARPLATPKFKNIDAYLREHLSTGITLDALAEVAEMDRVTFLRAFRNTTGQTPYQYLLMLRLNSAVDLLANSSLSIIEIAFACGFSSQQHMTNQFSRKLGNTPAKIRKTRREH